MEAASSEGKCPRCSVPVEPGSVECGACGVLFAKWLEKREKERLEAAEGLARMEAGAAQAPNPWKGRMIAVFLVAAWMLMLAGYILSERLLRPFPSAR